MATQRRVRPCARHADRGAALLVLWMVLAAAAPNGGMGAGGTVRPGASLEGTPDPVGPSLTVAPADWWMVAGTNVSLHASWIQIPPGCTISPEWFRWSVAVGGSLGTLSPTNLSGANFTAGGLGSGATGIVVRSAAELGCGSNQTAAFRTARSNLTIDAPLTVRNLSIAPNPIPARAVASLSGMIVGGQPPYELRISWGDGTVGWTNVTRPGTFSFNRSFEAGVYSPALLVEDGAGFLANDSVEEPLNVSPDFAVGVVPSSFVAEVGVPLQLTIADVNSPSGFSSVLSCGAAASAERPSGTPSPSLACTFADAGTSLVAFEAVGATTPYAVASALLDEEVVPALTVHIINVSTSVEADLPGYVPVLLSGGVPPFEISWRVVGNQSAQDAVVSADGTFYAAVRIAVPGADDLTVEVTDALGVSETSATETIDVLAPLSVNATAASGASTAGEVSLSGDVAAGSPPFNWAVLPGIAPENGTDPTGTLLSIGSFGWNATIRSEGALAVAVIVLDAAGAVSRLNVSADLVAPLRVSVGFAPATPSGFEAQITIVGGAPPFAYWINDSAGGSWNGSVAVDGTLSVRDDALGSGNTSFVLAVRDALGFQISSEAVVDLSAPSDGAVLAGSDVVAVGAGLAVLLAAGGAGVWWWRRRAGHDPLPGPDPEATLRRIIAPADGADRALVELVAEEEGVPMSVVRETLDRLIARGTVRAERGPDGEEVLAWSTEPAP
ncbi:MAG TPA: hypothetical protein VK455_02990 [Thermoplasmata archaeon]|nr:hypothetical protein [Thermoplasmata archaeon]